MQTTMCVGGRGGRGFCAKIYLKLEFWARIIPIVASVSLRQIPSDPIGFRGQWETIPTYIDGGAGNKVRGRGGRARQPKFLSRNLPKIRVFSVFYLNFRFRQIPPDSVSFRGRPWTSAANGGPFLHVLSGCRQQCMREVDRKPNSLSRYLSKIRVLSSSYCDFSFRLLPTASV